MSSFEEMFLEGVPYQCDACGGRMLYKGGGSYECMECGETALDDFGKVKEFLDQNGGTQPMTVIAENTGVSIAVLNQLLKDGRLQIPPGCKVYLRCEKCGCVIRSGRYCTKCELDMLREIKQLMVEEKRQRAKEEIKGTVVRRTGAKMRFADKDHL